MIKSDVHMMEGAVRFNTVMKAQRHWVVGVESKMVRGDEKVRWSNTQFRAVRTA